MNKNSVYEYMEQCELSFRGQLINFFDVYCDLINRLGTMIEDEKSENARLFQMYNVWLEEKGYIDFVNTIKQLDDNSNQRIDNFVKLYLFLLDKSKDDFDTLLDQLYYSLGQFTAVFANGHKMNVRIDEYSKSDNVNDCYTFTTEGIFLKVPFLFYCYGG